MDETVLKDGELVLMYCDTGAIVAGPWKGTGVVLGRAVATVGVHTEYFDHVVRIDRVDTVERVYTR